jgi:hypothetical protein
MNKKWLAAMPGVLLPVRFAARLPRARRVRVGPRSAPDEAERLGNAGLIAALAALAALGWLALREPALPEAAAADAPAPQFSAARAFGHVQALAQAPRPIGSTSNAQARAYLVDRLNALGLAPQIQETTVQRAVDTGFHNVHVTLAAVHNVVVRIPGTAPDHERQPALLLVAHYDSGTDTLGAADGAASSAAMLETLRALKAGPAPRYDSVFLFADGERIGGFGSQGFVEQHPLAGRIGLVLRFDNAGNRGPVLLADTSHASGEAIAGWARTGPHPHNSSLTRTIYHMVPGAPGIGPLARLDAPVLQLANAQGDLGVRDTPERIDRRSLQQEGDIMLGLARGFTAAPLARGAQAEQVFVTLPAVGVLHYSAALVWPLARLACLLLVGVCCLAAQRARVDPIRLVKGAFGFALFAFTLVLGTWLLWKDVPSVRRAAELLTNAYGPRFVFAFASLATAAFILVQRRLQRAVGVRAAALGGLVCVGLALLLTSWLAPEASYLLAWPLLAALAAIAALHSRRVAALPAGARLAIVAASAAPAVVLVIPALRDAYATQPPGLALALLALVLGLCIMPLATLARRYAVRALLAAGLACLVSAGAAQAHDDAAQPNPLVYYNDMPTWRAWWLAEPPTLDPAMRQLFSNLGAQHKLVEVFGWNRPALWYAPAPRTGVAFPDAVMLKNDSLPGRKHIEFTLRSKNKAPNIELSIGGGKPLRSSINGRVLTDEEDFSLSISLYGLEDQQFLIGLDLLGDPIAEIRVEERIPGLPAGALPPEVAAASARFLPMTAMTVAADTLLFR